MGPSKNHSRHRIRHSHRVNKRRINVLSKASEDRICSSKPKDMRQGAIPISPTPTDFPGLPFSSWNFCHWRSVLPLYRKMEYQKSWVRHSYCGFAGFRPALSLCSGCSDFCTKQEKILIAEEDGSSIEGSFLVLKRFAKRCMQIDATARTNSSTNKNTSQIALRWYSYYCLTALCIRAQYFITLQSVLHVVRASCYGFRLTPT